MDVDNSGDWRQSLQNLILVSRKLVLGVSDQVTFLESSICLINPFMPNGIYHTYQLDDSISNFRVVGWYFSFHSNFKINFRKQTVENQIRRRKPRRLIWFCTVCRCPTKRTQGLYRLKSKFSFSTSIFYLFIEFIEYLLDTFVCFPYLKSYLELLKKRHKYWYMT